MSYCLKSKDSLKKMKHWKSKVISYRHPSNTSLDFNMVSFNVKPWKKCIPFNLYLWSLSAVSILFFVPKLKSISPYLFSFFTWNKRFISLFEIQLGPLHSSSVSSPERGLDRWMKNKGRRHDLVFHRQTLGCARSNRCSLWSLSSKWGGSCLRKLL